MAQPKETESREESIKKIGEFIQEIDFTMMTTVDENGELQSRPMSTQNTEFDGNVYFFAFDYSDLAKQITGNPKVNLAYSAPDKQTYVSLSGEAQLIKDKAQMEALWQPGLKAWFPEGVETPGITLIKVMVKTAQYWDSPSGAIAYVVALIKATATGKSQEMGDSETVRIN